MAPESEKNVVELLKLGSNDEDADENEKVWPDEIKIGQRSRCRKKRFTGRQKISLAMLAAVDFMCTGSMSIMAPFYPKEAGDKGMSESMVGFVLGSYALVIFISSPIFGKILPRCGAKLLFISGISVSGICSIIFGTLHYVKGYNLFTALSFLVRGLGALGASAYSTAAFVLITNIFPEHASTVRGILETFVGLGLSVGPAIGGILYEAGGFGLPFYVMGSTILIVAPLNYFLLPPAEACESNAKSGSLTRLLRLPSVIISCMIIMVTTLTWSYLDPILEPHMRKFNLTPAIVGLIFLLQAATYGISSPVWGWVTDKSVRYRWLMIWGLFLSAATLLFLGPSPLLYFLKDSLALSLLVLALLGIFVAMMVIPSYQAISDSALQKGMGDNLGTNSVVAGLWSCFYYLGEVIGPVLGGYLMEKYKFAVTSTVIACINLVMGLIALCYFSTAKVKSRLPTYTQAQTTDILQAYVP